MASSLKLKIDISDEDIAAQFEEFQNCYPEGKISEEEFLEIFSKNNVFSPNSLFRLKPKWLCIFWFYSLNAQCTIQYT